MYYFNISKKFCLVAQMQSNFNLNIIIFFLVLEERASVYNFFMQT